MKELIRSSLTALALMLTAQIPNASLAADKKLEVFSWWNGVMAGAVIAALPTALVYIFLGRFFVRGLLAGSVKG